MFSEIWSGRIAGPEDRDESFRGNLPPECKQTPAVKMILEIPPRMFLPVQHLALKGSPLLRRHI